MTHIRSQMLLAATLASIAFTLPLQAQGGPGGPPNQPPRDGRGPQMGMRAPGGQDDMQGRRGNPASLLLRMRSQLELTDDQVKRLEALQNSVAPKGNGSDQLRARADLMDAMQGDGNLTKARAALDRMSALRNERMIAGLKQRQDVRGILTATQKTKLDNWQQQRRGRARGMGSRRNGGNGVMDNRVMGYRGIGKGGKRR